MTLEEEIKQSKFNSKQQRAMLNIIFTAGYINLEQTRLFKPYKISAQQFNVLRILRGQKGNPVSIGLIQDRMLDKQSNASRLIDKLEEKKMVVRAICPEDKRQMNITITNVGLDILSELDKKLNEMETSNKISNEEADLINTILNKIRQ